MSLLPKGKIQVRHLGKTHEYFNEEDAPEELIKAIPLSDVYHSGHIPRGEKIGRCFKVYGAIDSDPVGVFIFTEYLDNPFGYGKDDFHFSQYVIPKYSGALALRMSHGDLYYIAFKSEVANNLYSYVKVKEDAKDLKEFNRLDLDVSNNVGLKHTDTYEDVKYIRLDRLFNTEKGLFGILHMDGRVFRSMEVLDYWASVVKNTNPEKLLFHKAQLDRIVERKWEEYLPVG